MKYKHYQFKSHRSLVILLVLFAVLATTSVMLFINRDHTEASSSPQSNTNTQSLFSFDAAKAPGWHQGPTNTTSMVAFANGKDCWVSTEHKPGTVNEISEINNSKAKLIKDGYTVEPIEESLVTLQLNDGPRQYKLYQQNVTGTGGAGQLYNSQAFGYIQLADGYIFIQGYCDIADQLPTIIPVLQAIKFDNTK